MAAINPSVEIGNYVVPVSPLYSVRRFFSKVVFNDSSKFFVYAIGEEGTSLTPNSEGTFYFWSVQDSFGPQHPMFITDTAWGATTGSPSGTNIPGLVHSPSGFLTPVDSIMPKLAVPSFGVIDNGMKLNAADNEAMGEMRGDFNWSITEVNGAATTLTDQQFLKYAIATGNPSAKYLSVIYKDDTKKPTQIKLACETTDDSTRLENLMQFADDPTELVGNGACLILLNVHPNNAGQAQEGTIDGKENWSINISFPGAGEITMCLDSTGALLTDAGGGRVTKAQLSQAKAKEQPPQFQELLKRKGNPYCLVIYPVWNGVVVCDGIQDTANLTKVTSQYCIKSKTANVLDEAFLGRGPFTPTDDLGEPGVNWGGDGSGAPTPGGLGNGNPAEYNLLNFQTDGTASEIHANFGTGLNVELKGCRAELAYVPLFHLKTVDFDYYYLSGVDNPLPDMSGWPKTDVAYWQWAYPIWTDNSGQFLMQDYEIDDTYTPPAEQNNQEYRRMGFGGFTDNGADGPGGIYDRYGGEIFGFYFESDENRFVSVSNDDGVYPLDTFWNQYGPSGDPDPLPTWPDYIESLNVTIGQDSSSGSITIDKYGIAGQHADAIQSIGSVQITAFGNYPLNFDDVWASHSASEFDKADGTDNILFTGIGMGAGQSESSDGATFTIPLEGRAKKIEDIVLINAPYFDGYPLRDVIQFLATYGGLTFDDTQYHGDPSNLDGPIASSTDISNPLFDFRIGTSIFDAMNELADKTHHTWYIKRDGTLHWYEIQDDAQPVPGFDWTGFYDSPGSYTLTLNSRDNTPDFSDLRNEIVAFSLATNNTGVIEGAPLFPNIVQLSNPTFPTVPWSKMWAVGVPGVMDQSALEDIANNYALKGKRYLQSGSITVAGNPYIEPFDVWSIGGHFYHVESVSHTMDFNSKTWTTSVQVFGDTTED